MRRVIMTITRKSNSVKIASIVLTLAMILTVFCAAGSISAGAATDRVSLYSNSVHFSKYGGSSYEIFVQTKDNARNQEVYIHYNYLDSMAWQDVEAEYYTTLSDGSKIWRAYFSSFNTRFAIKYVADGVTYWDNNGGKDYNGTEVIGSAPIASERLGSQYYSSNGYRINAVLKNYAYHKNVFVRYTTDGWKSYSDMPMNYSKTNADGTETWTCTLNYNNYSAITSDFEYAICYRVNGQEYWANNFGENYDSTYYIHH